MMSSIDPEPDQPQLVITVGQDRAGHWLVQAGAGQLEGRFVSRVAALGFARDARASLPGARIEHVTTPLVPVVPFSPVQPWETAQTDRKAA